jgi:hypothetical protein
MKGKVISIGCQTNTIEAVHEILQSHKKLTKPSITKVKKTYAAYSIFERPSERMSSNGTNAINNRNGKPFSVHDAINKTALSRENNIFLRIGFMS